MGPRASSLVASAPPSDKSAWIHWNSDLGLAPKQIQAQFTATYLGQNLIITLSSNSSSTGDYAIDGPTFTVTLLKLLSGMVTPPSLPTGPLLFSVTVQPFIPADSEGVRVRTETKSLKSKVTVNLQFNATGVNSLPTTAPVLPSAPAPAAATGKEISTSTIPAPAQWDRPALSRIPGQHRSGRWSEQPGSCRMCFSRSPCQNCPSRSRTLFSWHPNVTRRRLSK